MYVVRKLYSPRMDSKVAALLVPTNEELMIARDTMELIG